MQIYREFSMSCSTFGGYTCKIEVNNIETVDDIVEMVLSHLNNTLQQYNFEFLIATLSKKRPYYHIHDVSIADILMGTNDIFYICDNKTCSD